MRLPACHRTQAVRPTWAARDRIPLGPGNSIVVNVTEPLDGDDVDAYLVVKPARRSFTHPGVIGDA